MYCVYWTRVLPDDDHWPCAAIVYDLKAALDKCEALRNEEGVRFVTMVSENPNSVGKPGVDVTGPDYNWTKRRTTELRNPKL